MVDRNIGSNADVLCGINVNDDALYTITLEPIISISIE